MSFKIKSKCYYCKRFFVDHNSDLVAQCDAFPDGIPICIVNGTIDHEKTRYKGDHGLLFEENKSGEIRIIYRQQKTNI